MSSKTYKTLEDTHLTVCEPAVMYEPSVSVSDKFNPNAPSQVTQEEFMEYIRKIESGNFIPWDIAQKQFNGWKKEYLASRLL